MTSVVTEMTGTVFSIVLVDLVLGGDNALVIGMASRTLPFRQRKAAVLWGTIGAVGLRLLFATVATVLLQIPYLMFAGGLTLGWIAFKLLVAAPGADHRSEGKSVIEAVRVIIAADAVMSLDNALAVAGIARGNLYLLAFGIALSVPIIVWGSNWISSLMGRFPLIVYAGAAALAWASGGLIFDDPALRRIFDLNHPWLIQAALAVLVTGSGVVMRRRTT